MCVPVLYMQYKKVKMTYNVKSTYMLNKSK